MRIDGLTEGMSWLVVVLMSLSCLILLAVCGYAAWLSIKDAAGLGDDETPEA